MKCVSALSTSRSTDSAVSEAIDRAVRGIKPEAADLALIFANSHHAGALGRIAEEVRRQGLGRHVIGCTGESIVGEDREVEEAPALAIWAIQLPGVTLTPRRLTIDERGLRGWEPPSPSATPKPTVLLLGDPFSFPTDRFLQQVDDDARGVQVIGGMASNT